MSKPNDGLVELQSAEEIVFGPSPVLRDVRFYGLHAELVEGVEPVTESNLADRADGEDPAVDIAVNIGLRTRQSECGIGIRVKFEASHETWKVKLDVAAEYEAEEPFCTSAAARVDFADKVGVMTLYPYIREAVGNLTQRTVGESYLLPIIRQGQISFKDESADAED